MQVLWHLFKQLLESTMTLPPFPPHVQEFDRAVQTFEGGVSKALDTNKVELKKSALEGGGVAAAEDLGAAATAAGGGAGASSTADQPSSVPSVTLTQAPAVTGPLGQTLAVPIIDPSELEPILGEDGKLLMSIQSSSSSSEGSDADAPVSPVGALAEGLDGIWTADEEQQQQLEAGEYAAYTAEEDGSEQVAVAEAEGVAAAAAGGAGGGYPTMQQQLQQAADENEQLMMQRISENVLAATVSQLIEAAENALDQEPKADMGVAEVDTAQLAADYLDELQVREGGCAGGGEKSRLAGLKLEPGRGQIA
jgi:hypothetical protein